MNKLFILTITFFGILNNYTSCKSHHRDKLAFNHLLPIGINDSVISPYRSTFYKTNYKDVVIYELPQKRTHEENGILVLDTTIYQFFIYKPGSTHGLFLDSMNGLFSKRSVDSLLIKSALKTLSVDPLEPYIVKSKKEIIDENNFVIRHQINLNPIDSVYFYFDKRLKTINHTYSRKMDSLHDSKLFRIKYLVKKDSSIYAHFRNDHRLTYFEVQPVRNANYSKLEKVYQKFKSVK